MKKFILGLVCGLVLGGSSAALASDTVKALLFPVSFEINGNAVTSDGSGSALNVNNSTYVPLRFIAEHLGATVGYDPELKKIMLKNGELDLQDPEYSAIRAGNFVVSKAGSDSIISGQLIFPGVGNTLNAVSATLTFYDDDNKKLGSAAFSGSRFGVKAELFSAKGAGDFRNYSTVILSVDTVNGQAVPKTSSSTYVNAGYHFTLQLPAYWEGKYQVKSTLNQSAGTENINFVTRQGGILFTILVWPQQEWKEQGASVRETAQIWKVGEQEDYVYALVLPGDVQYDPDNEEQAAEYHKLASYMDFIRSSFQLQN